MLTGELGWAYVAGFFDGEGYVGVHKQGRKNRPNHIGWGASVGIYQAGDRGKVVLTDIQGFLKSANIMSNLTEQKRSVNDPSRQDFWSLTIASRTSVVLFVKRIIPYLKVKKTEAEDVMRFVKLYEFRRSGVLYRQFSTMVHRDSGALTNHSKSAKAMWSRRKLCL